MELKDRSGNFWCDRSLDHLFQDCGLILAADKNEQLMAAHDGSDSHGVCLTRNIFFAGKETLICLDRCFSEVNTVCLIFKMVGWFVEANVTVVTETKKLDVSRSDAVDQFVVGLAALFAVSFRTIRNMSIVIRDVHAVKKMRIHEITIALFMGTWKSLIFIKIYSGDL